MRAMAAPPPTKRSRTPPHAPAEEAVEAPQNSVMWDAIFKAADGRAQLSEVLHYIHTYTPNVALVDDTTLTLCCNTDYVLLLIPRGVYVRAITGKKIIVVHEGDIRAHHVVCEKVITVRSRRMYHYLKNSMDAQFFSVDKLAKNITVHITQEKCADALKINPWGTTHTTKSTAHPVTDDDVHKAAVMQRQADVERTSAAKFQKEADAARGAAYALSQRAFDLQKRANALNTSAGMIQKTALDVWEKVERDIPK